MPRSTGSAMASASSAEQARNRFGRALRLAPARDDAEFQVFHQAGAQMLFQVAQDVPGQGEQLPLPDVVFHFDDQAGAHQLGGARVRGDLLADGLGPGGAGEFFGA